MAESAPEETSRGRQTARLGRLLALVLGIAAVATWVLQRNDSSGDAAPIRPITDDPDMFMAGADVRQFHPDGRLHYRLAAAEVRHFSARALTTLLAPDLWLHGDRYAPWHLRAEYGDLQRPGMTPDPALDVVEEIVHLVDAVQLTQTRANGDHIRLTTPSLTLYPQRQYAETEQDVMIESQVGRTEAVGLEGDLQLGLLRLFSAADRPVRTVLQPGQFK